MTPAQLATHAAKACADNTALILVLPKGQYPKRFPRGELLNEHLENGKPFRTYRFDAEVVFKWALKSGTVMVGLGDGGLTFSDVERPGQAAQEDA
jgi:hypothetical protein